MFRYTPCFLVLLTVLGSASAICKNNPTTNEISGLEQLTHSLRELFEKGDPEQAVQLFTEEAVILIQGEFVTGQKSIKEAFADMLETYDAIEWDLFSRTAAGADFESEMGTSHYRVKGTDTWDSFKYMATAVRGRDKKWRYQYGYVSSQIK